MPRARCVAFGQRSRHGRDDRDRDGRNERARQIEDRLAEIIDALGRIRRIGRPRKRAGEPAHIDHRVEQIDDLQARRAERDGDGDDEQLLHGLAGGLGLSPALPQDLVGLAELNAQIHDRHDAARRHAEDAARSRIDETAGLLEHQIRAAEAKDHADHGLIDLTDGGRGHVALALEEAPVGRDDADEQHARRQRRDGRPRIFIRRDHDGQRLAEYEHHKRPDDADGQEDLHGDGVDLADLRVILQRLRLRDHPADGDGQARRGDHEQHGVDVIGRGEIAVVCLADEAVERDFEEHADDLDDHRRQRQHRRTGQEILLLRCLFFQHSSVLSVGISCALLQKYAA